MFNIGDILSGELEFDEGDSSDEGQEGTNEAETQENEEKENSQDQLEKELLEVCLFFGNYMHPLAVTAVTAD